MSAPATVPPAPAGRSPAAEAARRPPAPLGRRLMAFIYEGLLLFGVVMLVGFAYGVATQQRHGLHGQHGLQAVLFVALGLYFVVFWTRGGQTLAMRTWHIRLQARDGAAVGTGAAVLRYLLSWAYLVPALALAWWLHLPSAGAIGVLVVAGALLWGATALLDPDRQFLHDRLTRTRLVDVR